MTVSSTDDGSGDEQESPSAHLAADVQRLKDFDRRLTEFDRRRASQHAAESGHWSPALGGDLPDHH